MKKKRLLLMILLLPLIVTGTKLATMGKKLHWEDVQSYAAPQESTNSEVKIAYLGTSCFTITYKGKTLLNDPFYSNPGYGSLVTGNYKDNEETDRKALALIGDSISMVLITHGHYDHCLDFNKFKPKMKANTVVVADESVCCALHAEMNGVHSHPKGLAENSEQTWIYSQDSVFRVLPIISEHNPHIAGIKFFGGSYSEPLENVPGPMWQWKEGNTYCFVIDLLDNGKIHQRLFMSAGTMQSGTIRKVDNILKEHKVNILFQAFWHHKISSQSLKIMDAWCQPDKIILHHWNNFFRSPESSLQFIRSSRLPETLPEFSKEGLPVCIMLPFSEAGF